VDALSIVTSIAGVCTSLGLGAMSINAGLQRLSWGHFRGENYGIPDDAKYSNPGCNGQGYACGDGEEAYGVQRNTTTQILAILIITCMSTVSVVLGIGRGIKFLSQSVFAMGTFLMLVVALNGETYLILDNIVQVTGYYLWYIIKIGFHCDAWERLGGKDMGLGGVDTGGGSTWIIDWTIFYWGWWISWGPFVGTFIAKISKARTLRTFIMSTLIVPTLYSIVWFCVWGTEGIRMQRMADTSGLCTEAYAGNGAWAAQYDLDTKKTLGMGWTPSCVLDDAYHGGYGRCKRAKFTTYVDPSLDGNGKKCVKTTNWVTVPCGGAADSDPTAVDTTYADIAGTECANFQSEMEALAAENYNQFPPADQPSCFVPLQDGTVCLYNRATADILFDQISSYAPRGYSDMLCTLTLIILTFYFVTSSDSGSFVVDMLASNGHPDPPLFQRVFWSFTEGSTAIALLYSGINHPNADASLKALQAASIITGLPYTFIMFWATQSLIIVVQEEAGDLDPDRKAFTTFIFNMKNIVSHLKHTAVPGIQMANTVVAVGKWPFSGFGPGPTKVIWGGFFSLLYYAAIGITVCTAAMYQWALIGCAFYVGYGTFVGLLRNHVRVTRFIKNGDLPTDLMCGLFAPMFTLTQIEVELKEGPVEKKDDPPAVGQEEI
jgi:choline-glycine betaine transporter